MSNYFGFPVSDELRKIWTVEQGLLDEFVRVCEKNNLNYFLDGGTLLGAVRHQGFIPWDDDIDVIMPRDDYDKLWKIAADEFKDPYFFQTTLSEEGFFRTHAQLRNSNTTGFIDEDGSKPQINKGIFLDVFCLDSIPDSKFSFNLLRWRIRINKAILAYEYDRPFDKISIKSKAFYIFVHALFAFVPFKSYFNYFNHNILGGYNGRDTKLVGDITLKWRENVQWPREWWSDYVMLEFEGKKYRAPVEYGKVLEKQYGDYMKLPEDVTAMNGKSHGNIVFDVDTPYREWVKKNV